MPSVTLACPNCGHEDEHSGDIFSEGDHYNIALGETHCDKCDEWFNVRIKR